MGIAERKERERDQLRSRILDAARELFVRDGYDAVTMRRIAERIEYSATAIYLHFADKDELIRQLCAHDFAVFAAQFTKLGRVADPLERLRRAGHAYIDFALAHPNHYRLLFMTPRASGAGGAPAEQSYAFLARTAAEAIATGKLRKDAGDAELVAQTCWAGVHGVAALHIAVGDDAKLPWRPVARRARAMIDTLVHGLERGGRTGASGVDRR
jgi:AcrR family transcriptional regulator